MKCKVIFKVGESEVFRMESEESWEDFIQGEGDCRSPFVSLTQAQLQSRLGLPVSVSFWPIPEKPRSFFE